MIYIEDKQYKYTKIKTEIILNKCPSDYKNVEYYLDVAHDDCQLNQCYIGEQFVESIRIKRKKGHNNQSNMVEPKWSVEIVVSEGKTEEEAIQLLNEFCEILSLNWAQNYELFQNHGFCGFSFEGVPVECRYAMEDGVFNEADFNGYYTSITSVKANATMQTNIFEFPMTKKIGSPTLQKLNKAFLRALRSQDIETRYILLYYLFEIIYDETAYQEIKAEYEKTASKKRDEKRSEILYRYLKSIEVENYISIGKKEVPIDAKILYKIIRTRNDLVHRADTSQIFQVMYHHLIPILQQVLRAERLLDENPE